MPDIRLSANPRLAESWVGKGKAINLAERYKSAALGRYGSKCYSFRVTATAPSTLRVFASKPFIRFARVSESTMKLYGRLLTELTMRTWEAESSSTGLHGKEKAPAEEQEP